MTNAFEKYAKYYDLTYKNKNYSKECDFLEMIFKKCCKTKPKEILDLACGTGNHSILLAMRGYKTTGIDASKYMIAIARDKKEKYNCNVDYHRGKMQNFRLNKKFDVVISMFSTIDYIVTDADLDKVLHNIKTHMKKNSLFIFDYWNGIVVLNSYSPRKIKIVKDSNIEIKRVSRTKIYPFDNICEVKMECIVRKNRKVIDRTRETHLIRYFFPRELKYILDNNGFRVLNTYPFMNINSDITNKTWDVTVVAKLK